MPNEDHHDEKPLSDVLRARHSEHGKRRGLHGKTARKLHNQRYSPATECGLTSSNTMPCSPFAHPCQRRLLSHFELEGRDASHSLNRDHAWEHVPSLLHERAIAPPRVHKRSNGLIETSFALEPVVEVVADAYRHAIARGYRFYSYGDAMFLPRCTSPSEWGRVRS